MIFKNIVYGSHYRNTLDLCLPKNKSGKIGLVLCLHGGGWIEGDKESYFDDLLFWQKQGYASASINYRYANGKNILADAILDDITASLTKIKQVGLENGFDIQNVMFCGFSAGSHLALLYAYKNKHIAPIQPKAVAGFSSPTDLTDPSYQSLMFADDIYFMISKVSGVLFNNLKDKNFEKTLQQISPINYVTKNSVPTILCHGLYDDVVPYSNSEKLSKKLADCGIKHDFITFSNSGHSLEFDQNCWHKATILMLQYAKEFL